MKQKTPVKAGEWVEIMCAFCGGTGKNPFAAAKCPACGGRRKVRVQEPLLLCAYCEGTGANGRMTCTICGGKGVITVKEQVQPCPACGGHGRDVSSPLRLSCPVCEGKGVVPI